MPFKAGFGQALRKEVGDARQVEIAKQTDLSPGYISQMFAEDRVPPRPTLREMMERLELSEEAQERLWRAAGYADVDATASTDDLVFTRPEVEQIISDAVERTVSRIAQSGRIAEAAVTYELDRDQLGLPSGWEGFATPEDKEIILEFEEARRRTIRRMQGIE